MLRICPCDKQLSIPSISRTKSFVFLSLRCDLKVREFIHEPPKVEQRTYDDEHDVGWLGDVRPNGQVNRCQTLQSLLNHNHGVLRCGRTEVLSVARPLKRRRHFVVAFQDVIGLCYLQKRQSLFVGMYI